MDTRTYDRALGAALSAAAEQSGWTVAHVGKLTRIRPRRLRRVFLGKSPVGPVELQRLLWTLGLNRAELERQVFADAEFAQLVREVEGAEIDRRLREHL